MGLMLIVIGINAAKSGVCLTFLRTNGFLNKPWDDQVKRKLDVLFSQDFMLKRGSVDLSNSDGNDSSDSVNNDNDKKNDYARKDSDSSDIFEIPCSQMNRKA